MLVVANGVKCLLIQYHKLSQKIINVGMGRLWVYSNTILVSYSIKRIMLENFDSMEIMNIIRLWCSLQIFFLNYLQLFTVPKIYFLQQILAYGNMINYYLITFSLSHYPQLFWCKIFSLCRKLLFNFTHNENLCASKKL